MHFAGEVFEEAFEFVQVAVGGREQLLRVDAFGADELLHVDLEGVAEALDASADPDGVARREAGGDGVGVSKDAPGMVPVRSRSCSAR